MFRRVRCLIVLPLMFVFFLGQLTAATNINLPAEDTFVFVILRHVREETDNALWRRCYKSIREFYRETPIIIIDDNSKIAIADSDLENTTVIKSEFPGAGELLPYYYFLKHKWADKMIFVHDSMFLRREFSQTELSHPVRFHWHFQVHNWDDDAKINEHLMHLRGASELIVYNMMKFLWHGCFGVASTIRLNVLEQIERTYSFTSSLINTVKTRNDRMAIERIYAILLFKEALVTLEQCSNFGSIFDHPLAWAYMSADDLESIKLTYDSALIKTWQGR